MATQRTDARREREFFVPGIASFLKLGCVSAASDAKFQGRDTAHRSSLCNQPLCGIVPRQSVRLISRVVAIVLYDLQYIDWLEQFHSRWQSIASGASYVCVQCGIWAARRSSTTRRGQSPLFVFCVGHMSRYKSKLEDGLANIFLHAGLLCMRSAIRNNISNSSSLSNCNHTILSAWPGQLPKQNPPVNRLTRQPTLALKPSCGLPLTNSAATWTRLNTSTSCLA